MIDKYHIMMSRLMLKPKRFVVYVTTALNLNHILTSGIAPTLVTTRSQVSGLKGVFVNDYPHGFDLLTPLLSNSFPVALKIEITAPCDIMGNDHYIHEDHFKNVSGEDVYSVLKHQAGSVFDIYGSAVLPADSLCWKIVGFQTFDKCIFQFHNSVELIKQREKLLNLVKHSYFRTLLRIPLNHVISCKALSYAKELTDSVPFVTFDQEHVEHFFDRCGGRNVVLDPSAPLLNREEIENLKGPPESIVRYIKSFPEPPGMSPPVYGTEPEHATAFDLYAKAKFLKKPLPPPPVTFKTNPVSCTNSKNTEGSKGNQFRDKGYSTDSMRGGGKGRHEKSNKAAVRGNKKY